MDEIVLGLHTELGRLQTQRENLLRKKLETCFDGWDAISAEIAAVERNIEQIESKLREHRRVRASRFQRMD